MIAMRQKKSDPLAAQGSTMNLDVGVAEASDQISFFAEIEQQLAAFGKLRLHKSAHVAGCNMSAASNQQKENASQAP